MRFKPWMGWTGAAFGLAVAALPPHDGVYFWLALLLAFLAGMCAAFAWDAQT